MFWIDLIIYLSTIHSKTKEFWKAQGTKVPLRKAVLAALISDFIRMLLKGCTDGRTRYLLSARSVLFPTNMIMTSLPLSVLTSSIHFVVCWKELTSEREAGRRTVREQEKDRPRKVSNNGKIREATLQGAACLHSSEIIQLIWIDLYFGHETKKWEVDYLQNIQNIHSLVMS